MLQLIYNLFGNVKFLVFKLSNLNPTSGIVLCRSKKPLFVQLCTALYNFLKVGFHVASHATLHTHISSAKAKRRKVSHHQVKSKNLISTQTESVALSYSGQVGLAQP